MRDSLLAASAVGLTLCSVVFVGCDQAPQPSKPALTAEQKATEKKTTAQTVLEGVTGKAAVDQGNVAREKLRAVDAQRRKDMEALEK